MEAGPEQYFIRIDVTDPGNGLLMHEQRFESAPARRHQLYELLASHAQRFVPESPADVVLEAGSIEERQASEPARIPIA